MCFILQIRRSAHYFHNNNNNNKLEGYIRQNFTCQNHRLLHSSKFCTVKHLSYHMVVIEIMYVNFIHLIVLYCIFCIGSSKRKSTSVIIAVSSESPDISSLDGIKEGRKN